jgi:tetratricopeptide (TPR) repeat protein
MTNSENMAKEQTRRGGEEESQPPDPFTRAIENIFAQWRKIVAVCVCLVILAAVYAYAVSRQQQAENATWAAIAQARRDNTEAKALSAALEQVVETHQGTAAVAYARMSLVRLCFDSEDTVKALAAAEDFLKHHAQHPFAPQVRADYARLLEWRAKWGPAREEYERVLASGKKYLAPEAQLGMARCLERENRPADAREAYLKIRSQAEREMWPYRVRMAANLRLMALAPKDEGMAQSADTAPDEGTEEKAAEKAADTSAPGTNGTTETE